MASNVPEVAHLINDRARTRLPLTGSLSEIFISMAEFCSDALPPPSRPAVPSPSRPAPTICSRHMPPKGNKPHRSSEVLQSEVSLCES